MFKYTFLLVAIIFSFLIQSCSAPANMTLQKQLENASNDLTQQEWNDKGTTLKTSINNSIDNYRGEVGSAKDNLSTVGPISAGVGAVSALLVGAFKPENTKTTIGVGSGVIVAIIGVYQAILGAKNDDEGYIREGNDDILAWDLASKSTLDDAKIAYISFMKSAYTLKDDYLVQSRDVSIPSASRP
jgi:hypothetical protein